MSESGTQAILVLKQKVDRSGTPKSFDVVRVDGTTVDRALDGLAEDHYHVVQGGNFGVYKVELVQRNTKVA